MALVFLFLYAPILVLVAFSFNEAKSSTVWTGFSLHWYTELFQDTYVLEALQTTLLVSILATNLKKRFRTVCLTVNNIPLTNADIITGVSMMLLFVAAISAFSDLFGVSIQLGFGTLLMAHITFDIPYVILSVMPKLRQLDPNIYEAAQDLGASGFYAFRKVILPEIMPGILNGALIAFTMSIDDFVISYFTAGSGANTLSMVVYSMVRRRISPEINALSTLMFTVVIVLMVAVNLRQSHQDKRLAQAIRAEQRTAANRPSGR